MYGKYRTFFLIFVNVTAIYYTMIIDFDKIDLSILPAFKGGEKEYAANMFFDGTNRIMRGKLIPGASIGLHTHDTGSEIMFFTSGKGHVIYDGERKEVNAGLCHYCPKGHSHTLINDSDADLCFYAAVVEQ